MKHIDNMYYEQKELNLKIVNLKKFLNETANLNEVIDDEQINNLNDQLLAMELYNSILIRRLSYDCDKYNWVLPQ